MLIILCASIVLPCLSCLCKSAHVHVRVACGCDGVYTYVLTPSLPPGSGDTV